MSDQELPSTYGRGGMGGERSIPGRSPEGQDFTAALEPHMQDSSGLVSGGSGGGLRWMVVVNIFGRFRIVPLLPSRHLFMFVSLSFPPLW